MTLDAPMMFFMGYTLPAWVNFHNHRNRPFTRGWWTWLLQTGVGLFLSSSVKWVGSFTTATTGLCVLTYLQESRKHLYLSTRDFQSKSQHSHFASSSSQSWDMMSENPSAAFEGYIYDGDLVRLRHCYTKVALSASELESVGSNKSFIKEVRGVQWSKKVDVKEREETDWRVELVPEGTVPRLVTAAAKQQPVAGQDLNNKQREGWHSIKGFRLFNEQQNCYLMSHKVFRTTYFSYQEVGYIQDNRQKGDTIFVVDRNVNSHLPPSTPSYPYQPLTFLQKFIEINKVMWWSHHDLASPIHSHYHFPAEQLFPHHKGIL
ncbi:hypothetical protein BGW39_006447 [Mortierella sp. 14UC]|nr:hypothetical protein BGW39_006447 [Mortierella sp. 14UC]